MALRHKKEPEIAEAKLLTLPPRAESLNRFDTQVDDADVPPSPSEHTRDSNRRLRNLIILANALAWAVIVATIRFAFY